MGFDAAPMDVTNAALRPLLVMWCVIAPGFAQPAVTGGGTIGVSDFHTGSNPLTSAAGVATTTSLASSGSPSTFGRNLTLIATVSPAAASGSVAFYDGITLLGNGPLTGGKAVLTTILLPAGTQSLRAQFLGGNGYSSSTSTVLLQTVNALPGNGFAAAVNYGVDSDPYSTAAGDFNGDGKADLAVANLSGNDVSILLGNGDGTFQSAVNYAAGYGPFSLAVADFNGDGHPDLVVANAGSNSVGVLLGNGNGTFQAQIEYAAAGTNGSGPDSVAVGDLNGDGYADIVAISQNSVTSVYLGRGDGTFAAAVNYGSALAYNTPFVIGVGDFNGDGKPDLATVGDGSLNVLPGNGDGTFQLGVIPSITAFADSIVITDLNGDGKADIAIPTGSQVSVLLGNGNGSFHPPLNYALSNADAVAVGDINGDGIPDLVASAFDGNTLSGTANVFLGNGDGTFQAGASYAVGNSPYSLAVADFNGDGRADIAVANSDSSSNNVSVLVALVATLTQTVTFGQIGNVTYGVSPFALGGSASSGLAISFASTTSGVCTVAGTMVTIVGGGVCTLVASQAGNATYAAAAPVTQSFIVNPASQTIAFAGINGLGVGVLPFAISATATSGLAVSFASTTAAVCTVSGATVTLLTAGTCIIQATQAGSANYAAATPVNQSFPVSQYSPCDLKQSGGISVTDVQLIINEALGVVPAVNNLTGTGVVNVVAVQIEINAALGMGCAAR